MSELPTSPEHHPFSPALEGAAQTTLTAVARNMRVHDRAAYRLRNRVERLINRLKQFRRIATRYEKRAANYLAMLTIGMILLWI